MKNKKWKKKKKETTQQQTFDLDITCAIQLSKRTACSFERMTTYSFMIQAP